jgi:hypothetical protein
MHILSVVAWLQLQALRFSPLHLVQEEHRHPVWLEVLHAAQQGPCLAACLASLAAIWMPLQVRQARVKRCLALFAK